VNDTQTLEGAVALLRELQGATWNVLFSYKDKVNAFLALPSVSPVDEEGRALLLRVWDSKWVSLPPPLKEHIWAYLNRTQPSAPVSPGLPADAPGEGQFPLRVDRNGNFDIQFEGEWVGWNSTWSTPELDKNSRFRERRAEYIAYLNALTSAPAPSSEALREALIDAETTLDDIAESSEEAYAKQVARAGRRRARAALAAEEAQS
jgi:hypothetical protein